VASSVPEALPVAALPVAALLAAVLPVAALLAAVLPVRRQGLSRLFRAPGKARCCNN